jgi:hypothetical protein
MPFEPMPWGRSGERAERGRKSEPQHSAGEIRNAPPRPRISPVFFQLGTMPTMPANNPRHRDLRLAVTRRAPGIGSGYGNTSSTPANQFLSRRPQGWPTDRQSVPCCRLLANILPARGCDRPCNSPDILSPALTSVQRWRHFVA